MTLDEVQREPDLLHAVKRAEQHDEWAIGRRYMTPVACSIDEALPEADLERAAA